MTIPTVPVACLGGQITLIYDSDANNVNLFSDAGSPVGPVNVLAIIEAGVTIGSASTGTHAFDTGTGWAAGSRLVLINHGEIQGKGGNGGTGGNATAPAICQSCSTTSGGVGLAGGPALRAQYPLSVINNGAVRGGGGGGGGAGAVATTLEGASPPYYTCFVGQAWSLSGAGGGGGRGGGSGGSRGVSLAFGQQCTSGTFYFSACPASGNNGTNTNFGTGGASSCITGGGRQQCQGGGGNGGAGGSNGTGGGIGQVTAGSFNHSSTSSGGSFGAGGAAVNGNSNITWLVTGTREGALNA